MTAIYLGQFLTVSPPFYIDQQESIEWLIKYHKRHSAGSEVASLEKLFRRYGVKAEQIAGRYLACPAMVDPSKQEGLLAVFSDISHKSEFCKEYFYRVFEKIYPKRERLPPHLIHVTCTGYLAPSAPQRLVSALRAQVNISHAYHMGCYAALPAIRLAQALVKSGDCASVDIVHTEACTLHMDPTDHAPEALVVQTLFADGNIKYSVSSAPSPGCFELLHVQEQVLPDSVEDMTWELRKWGFAMTLSREVPLKIPQALPKFFERFVVESGVCGEKLFKEALFAVHPGGPRIITAVSQALDLQEWQISASQQILRTYGNMSSATLPHVWHKIAEQDPEDGTLVVSLAFGPGLSVLGSLFRWQRGRPC